MNHIRNILLSVLILSAVPVFADDTRTDNDRFANRKLAQLFEQLPISVLPQKDTIIFIPEITPDKEVIFNFNRKDQLSHLGISLFSSEIKQMLDWKICDFIERFFLELLLEKDNSEIVGKLEMLDVELTCCGRKLGEGPFKSIANEMHIMNSPVGFSLKYDDKRATASWSFNQHNLQLSFPLYRELIEGSDKKESDNHLYELLQSAAAETIRLEQTEADLKKTRKLADGIYVSEGDVLMVQNLSSDRYYVLNGDKLESLYSRRYPEYSMNNIFLTYEHGEDKSLRITHRKYGHFTPELIIPLHNFLACFHNDFQTYCHTSFNKDNELETIVVLSHNKLNYIHMLRVHAKPEEFFKPSPVLKADFYSNIPQHYIKSLFQ